MNIINSVCSTNNYLFGGDLYGIVYLWNLKSIYVEHLTRKVETQRNNNVYTYTCKFKISDNEIKNILIQKDNIYIATSSELFFCQLKSFLDYLNEVEKKGSQNPNLIRIQLEPQIYDIAVISMASNDLIIGSPNGFVYIIQNEELLKQLNTNQYVNKVIQSLVSINVNPVTSIVSLGQNKLIIGSELGLLQIWQDYNYEKVLKQRDTLSGIIGLVYNQDSGTLYSLHEQYLLIWNMIIEEPIKKIDKEGYSTMCLYNNKILLGDNNKIEILGEQKLETSSNQVLGIQLVEQDIVISHGSSPFLDIFKQLSYEFTVCCL